jgi:hypothetical protein
LPSGPDSETPALSAGGLAPAALPAPRQQPRPIAAEGARALREWLHQG